MIPAEHPEHGMIREVRVDGTAVNHLNDKNEVIMAPPRWIVVFHDGAVYELKLGMKLASMSPTLEKKRDFKPPRKGGTGNNESS